MHHTTFRIILHYLILHQRQLLRHLHGLPLMAKHIFAQLINDQLAAFNVLLRSFKLNLQSINLILLFVLERLNLVFLLN